MGYSLVRNFFIIVLLSIAYNVSAKTIDSSDWMAHYYKNPQPEVFVQWLKQISSEGYLDNKETRFPLTIFISEVIKQSPENTINWCTALVELPEKHQQIIAWSFKNANTVDYKKCIVDILSLNKNITNKLLKSRSYDPLKK